MTSDAYDTAEMIGAIFRPELAFPVMPASMVLQAKKYGEEIDLPSATKVFGKGDRMVDFFIVLSGTLRVTSPVEVGDSRTLGDVHAGQFTGEIDLLSSQPSLVDVVAIEPTKVLRISRDAFQSLMKHEAGITNLITQAAAWRRIGILQNSTAALIIVGDPHAADTVQLRRFLLGNGYPHRLIEPGIEELEEGCNHDTSPPRSSLPTVVLSDGKVLYRPSLIELATNLGLIEQLDSHTPFDLAVIGAGPAGLAAAVYGASEGLKTVIIEGVAPGGQAGTSSKIENYLGFPTGVSGWELSNRAQMQAQKFGARLAIARKAEALIPFGTEYDIRLTGGTYIRSRAVVIATGAQYRKLRIPNYDRYEYQGIHYAATGMEATLCRGKAVVIVGGGNSAGQAAIFLSSFVSRVLIVIRGDNLRATMSQYLISRIEHASNVEVRTQTVLSRLNGNDYLNSVEITEQTSGAITTLEVGGVFVMIGAEPHTSWLGDMLVKDAKGFVCTGLRTGFEETPYATSLPGVYAVGDVRSSSIKRVASAVGEGSVVISDVHRYLAQVRV